MFLHSLHDDFDLFICCKSTGCLWSQVLTGYVKSIEDHGYILHFGLSSFTGFLPKDGKAGKYLETSIRNFWHG